MKIIKEIGSYILIILLVIIIRMFIVTPVKVDGPSMEPTLEDKQILILKKYDKSINRFDIVVFKLGDTKIIKRVIGLPGEHVAYKDNKLYINNQLLDDVKLDVNTSDFSLEDLRINVIPKGYYFVLGDNRTNSTDSRLIGLVSIDDILGVADFRIFPFNKFGKFN